MLEQEVVEIIRPVNSGQTEPYQCRLEDGELYAVKGRNATPSGLIAEVVAGQLGQRLGLPIPHFCVCRIPSDLLESAADPNAQISLGSGPCFASHWVEPSEVFSLSMIRKIGDVPLAQLYVFDHWIENGDRTLTPRGGNVNLLLSLANDTLVAYDHNLAFSDSHDPSYLEIHVGRASWRRAKDIVGFRANLETQMKALLAASQSLEDDLPSEWIDEAPNMIDRVTQSLERVETEQFWNELG